MYSFFLTPLERWLIRRLIKSPRIGFIMVKEFGSGQVWALRDTTDPVVASLDSSIDFVNPNFKSREAVNQDIVNALDLLYKAPDADR
jgi:hypothetical protein